VVIGMGGGSAMDTAKAVAALAVNGGSVKEYLEGVGTGRKLENAPLPFIAVPSTAGTGAEVTKNAVIAGAGYKKSFRDERLYARVVFIDPVVASTAPREVTAESGMDAITQLIESYTTKRSNLITDGLCLAGLKLARSLPECYFNGKNLAARADMSAAALLSGICLANSGLGAAHGLAASLGASLGISHGRACATMLPHVMRLNLEACEERYADAAEALCGVRSAEKLISEIEGLNARFNIPSSLKAYNISESKLSEIAEGSFGSSMSGNPVQLDKSGWEDFLRPLI